MYCTNNSIYQDFTLIFFRLILFFNGWHKFFCNISQNFLIIWEELKSTTLAHYMYVYFYNMYYPKISSMRLNWIGFELEHFNIKSINECHRGCLYMDQDQSMVDLDPTFITDVTCSSKSVSQTRALSRVLITDQNIPIWSCLCTGGIASTRLTTILISCIQTKGVRSTGIAGSS